MVQPGQRKSLGVKHSACTIYSIYKNIKSVIVGFLFTALRFYGLCLMDIIEALHCLLCCTVMLEV